MPTTAKGFRYPAGTDLLSQGDDAIHNLASDVDGFPGWIPVGGASGAVLAKASASDYATAWTTPHYVPAGGASGQHLSKASGADYDLGWSTPHDLPAGGSTGQVLAKASAVDYAVAWQTPAGGGGGGAVELAYGELSTLQTLTTAATEAAPVALITLPAVTFDGTSTYEVEIGLNITQLPSGSGRLGASLWSTVDLGRLLFQSAIGVYWSARRWIPSAGSVALSLRGWTGSGSSGSGIAGGDVGGAGKHFPAFLRVSRL